MAQNKKWEITTSSDRPLRDIAKDLAECGLIDVQVLDEIGVITGLATDKAAAKLHKVPGVKTVEPSIRPDVGPPDSPDTW
mgnify:CR=1 FL=1